MPDETAKHYGELDHVYRHADGRLRVGTVYVLHFEWGLNDNGGFLGQHYVGWTSNLSHRLKQHVTLGGSPWTQYTLYVEARRFVLGAALPNSTVEDEQRIWAKPWRACELCAVWRSGDHERANAMADERLAELLPVLDELDGASASTIRSIWVGLGAESLDSYGVSPWFLP